MLLRSIGIFLLTFFVFPLGIGWIVFPQRGKTEVLFGGFGVSLCIYEILMLLFHITMGSLRVMTVIWFFLCVALAVFGIFRKTRNRKEPITTPALAKIEWFLLLCAGGLVVLQVLYTVVNAYYGNWDDETYCATAVVSLMTDTVDRYTPQKELLREVFYNAPYNIADWPIFSSMLAILSGIHPTIIFRTILPILEIPLAYYIAYRLLRCIFQSDRKNALLGLIYYQLFVLLAAEQTNLSSEWWLAVNCWSGKALAFNIVTPAILWCLLQLESCKQEDRKDYWCLLFIICSAACAVAASLFMTVPVELAIWGIFYLFRTKRWKDFWKFALCGLPTVVCALLTIIF